jgi:Mg-chelatase subunit ChlD
MVLIKRKDGLDLDPKGLWRLYEILNVPGVAEINRQLGFGNSARNPALGRLPKAVTKWLGYRENNLPLFQGLVKKGWKTTVKRLCKKVGFKPETPQFFQVLRWKQEQAPDGRRGLGIGDAVAAAESWEGLTERQICEKITQEKLSYKKIVGLLPKEIGLTRAIMAACVISGALSDTDLLILTPTLEELGLLDHAAVKPKYDAAILAADSQRAANIALKVKHKESAEKLQDAADGAMKKAVEEVTKDIRLYVIVDKSGSMEGALEKAKVYLTQFLGGFPLDRVHVSTFNTHGKALTIKHASAAGVAQAFQGERAGGGTTYASGVTALMQFPPKENEDSIMIFVGDQADSGHGNFVPTVERSGLRPTAFGLIEIEGQYGLGRAVEETANRLGIPCFRIEEDTFNDPYSIPRTISNLIASTPVGESTQGRVRSTRVSLVETILKTDLLKKPVWA